jgi:hypothetical protein
VETVVLEELGVLELLLGFGVILELLPSRCWCCWCCGG